jgi:hypothetical protein
LLAFIIVPLWCTKGLVTSLVREKVIRSPIQHISKQHDHLVGSLKHPTK